MYKLIVVDDEPRVRRGLKNLIHKLDSEWVVVGDAKNGYEALEVVEREMPDLVITDIRMPQMNGLDLLGHLKEYPVHVVILSGYGYFEYAQTAVKYGAFDYLLKPLKPEDIQNVLSRVKEERKLIPENHRNSSNTPNYSKIWKKWLVGLQEEKEVPLQLRSVFPIHPAQIRIFIIDIDMLDELIKEDQWGDRQLVLFAVRNIVQDVITRMKADARFLFINSSQLYFLKVNGEDAKLLFESCIDEVKKWLKISISIGVSDSSDNYQDSPELVQHALLALQNKCFYGNGTLNEYDDVKMEEIIEIGYPIKLEAELMKEIRAGQNERAASLLQQFVETVKQSNVPFQLFRRFCLQLVSSVIRLTYEQNIHELVMASLTKPIDLFDRMFTLQEYVEFMDSLITACINSAEWSRKQKQNHTIEKALNFIGENYTKDISLEDAARHVHMNASYLSSYFKLETGSSFVEYVTSLRMDKAKSLMMDSQLRLYEIAKMVGYQEVKYFSRLFKKKMGVTPIEYRQFFFRKDD